MSAAPRRAPDPPARRARARSTRHRDARCRAAVVRRTGEDEPTQTPGVVRRAFAVDLGGPTPAAVALAFPDATDAVCFELTRPLGVVFEQRLSGATTEIFVDEVFADEFSRTRFCNSIKRKSKRKQRKKRKRGDKRESREAPPRRLLPLRHFCFCFLFNSS